jgi:hypothetical protein
MNQFIYKFFHLIFITSLLFITACNIEVVPSITPSPIPTQSKPMETPDPILKQEFPNTLEDSVFAALSTYRREGYDVLKTTWLTTDYANQMSFYDFLATIVNNIPTTPSALMGWEILKVEQVPDSQAASQGIRKVFLKTSYLGNALLCRWMTLAPPNITGDHWRISGNENVPCDGQASAISTPTPQSISTSVAPTSVSLVWFPCSDAPASQLQIGNKVYVNPYPPLGQWIHFEPGKNTDVVGMLNPGDVFTISGGPKCATGYVYWQTHIVSENTPGMVETYDGWVAEAEQGSYWLLPCPASGPCGGGFKPARTPFKALTPSSK